MKSFITSALVFVLYKILYITWRIEFKESGAFQSDLKLRKPYLLSVWHGNELASLHITKRYKLAALVSQSKDGDLMNRVLQWMGVKTTRGSSSRGAISGFKGLIRLAKTGLGSIFAVDGPKGPYRKAKPGIFELARLTKGSIYPLGVSVSSYWISLRSWNKAILPKPFAKIVIVVGESLEFDPKITSTKSPDLGKDLQTLMHGAEQESLALLATK